MKSEDIVVGGTYANERGHERRVVDEGARLARYCHQFDKDCIQWKRYKGGKRGRRWDSGEMTRKSFAKWAVSCIDSHEG